LKVDFVRFCIVGGLGFVINFIILVVLAHIANIPVFIAQLIGAEIALFSNFMLHNNWTYKSRKSKKSFTTLLTQFHATSWPAILGSSLMVSLGVNVVHLTKLVALGISSMIALLWNFAWSKYVVWRTITEQEIEEIGE